MVPICSAGTVGGSLTYYATALDPGVCDFFKVFLTYKKSKKEWLRLRINDEKYNTNPINDIHTRDGCPLWTSRESTHIPTSLGLGSFLVI